MYNKEITKTIRKGNEVEVQFRNPIIIYNRFEQLKLASEVRLMLLDLYPEVFFGYNVNELKVHFAQAFENYPIIIYGLSAKT